MQENLIQIEKDIDVDVAVDVFGQLGKGLRSSETIALDVAGFAFAETWNRTDQLDFAFKLGMIITKLSTMSSLDQVPKAKP